MAKRRTRLRLQRQVRRRRGCDEALWLESLPEAVLVTTRGSVAYANRAARELFDPSNQKDLRGHRLEALLIGPCEAAAPLARRLDGSSFAVSTRDQQVRLRHRPAHLQLVLNIEHELRLQQRLENKRRALRALSGGLIQLQERERRSIARELHDEIGQCLSAIRVQFAKLHRRVDSPEALALIDSAASMTERALGRVRSLSLLLHPPQLETLGLSAALRWHLEEQQRLHGLRIRFVESPITRPVHPDLAIAVYRIVQESLSNALRHAHAKEVTVRLLPLEHALALEVTDDGDGFDLGASLNAQAPTLGLVGMTERARLLGGELNIESAPGKGTQIAAHFPWKVPDDS